MFLRLGLTAFGGPAAHLGLMEDEVVHRRRWVTRERFLDLVAASNLLPGPNSTELAIHLGLLRAGWPGFLAAGACFILPAALLSGAIAWAYLRFGALPAAGALLYGIKPAVLAVVVQALVRLAPAALRTARLALVGLVSLGAAALGAHELVVLAVAGMAAGALAGRPRALAAAPLLALPAGAASAGAGSLFLVFLKIGSVLFGSGYVLLAFLRADFVTRLGWLTEGQLLDAVAVGQITPGPVFSTATFIGYLLGGAGGAAAATAGIFLPAFVLVALCGPLMPRLRRWPAAGAALDGVVAASLALMALVTFQLARAAVVDLPSAALAVIALVVLLRWRVNSAWLVIGGALAGLVL